MKKSAKNDLYRTGKWIKYPVPRELQNGHGWDQQISEIWVYRGTVNFAVQVRELICGIGTMKHVIIKKVNADAILSGKLLESLEPTYQDKIRIRQVLKCQNRDMIEVMPARGKLVDMANLYHAWILPEDYESQFKFSPSMEFHKYDENYEIAIKEPEDTKNVLQVISIKKKNGQPLSWKEKQKIKDTLWGREKIAVEIIPKKVTYISNVCELVCLPEECKLPFGIYDEEGQQ